jgi:transcriptional regulator with XRE-family HTH domain
MSNGYSSVLIYKNKVASKSSLGVSLGRICIAKNVPVIQVAASLGVSRATIYNWFKGYSVPYQSQNLAIKLYIEALKIQHV